MNKSNRNQNRINTMAGKTKDDSQMKPFKTAIVGGLRGGGPLGRGEGDPQKEDGADDIFN